MLKRLTILPCLLMMYQPLNAKVEAPNYDFSLNTLDSFFPEKKISDIEAKLGRGEAISSQHGLNTTRFKVEHIRYKFTVLVQSSKEGLIHDFFARLPTYFLHDIFLNSLVKRLGKQTSYKKAGEEAYYVWSGKGLKHVYSAACTITCFPVFYSVAPEAGKSLTLLDQMKKASSGK